VLQIYYRDVKTEKLRKLQRQRAGAWLHVEKATAEDLKKVSKLLNVDEADLIDILDDAEIPRIERHGDTVIIFLRLPISSGNKYTQTFVVAINTKYIATLAAKTTDLDSQIIKAASFTSQRVKMLGGILLQVAQAYTKQIKALNHKLDLVQSQKNISDADVAKLIELEEVLNEYLLALVPMRTVFNVLVNARYLTLYEDDKDLLEDIVININQSVELCSVHLKSIRAIRDSYQIILTNRLNRQIKFLTAFTIIMTIPTIIGSWFGMNVELPFATQPWAFALIIALSVGLVVLCVYIFYRNRWL
jgi:magnesium transporter